MIYLKENQQQTFDIDYNVTNDGKTAGDIANAKFFLQLFPEDADDKYFQVTLGSGLEYNTGVWTVTVPEGDFNYEFKNVGRELEAILAIQYTGDTEFREPDLFEGEDRLQVKFKPVYNS